MRRDADDRIADILEAVARCVRYAPRLDASDPGEVQIAGDAIERNLQIIGEAASHLPPEITQAHPEVPWPSIRGMRNILVHEYFGVSPQVVRDVVDNHLSVLAGALR